ncbi:hypothetical protein N8758_04810, partial [Crocinitomicaceae bacterium]|nr:hypothetical protein [Crocinitomicaceae bacterium]
RYWRQISIFWNVNSCLRVTHQGHNNEENQQQRIILVMEVLMVKEAVLEVLLVPTMEMETKAVEVALEAAIEK